MEIISGNRVLGPYLTIATNVIWSCFDDFPCDCSHFYSRHFIQNHSSGPSLMVSYTHFPRV